MFKFRYSPKDLYLILYVTFIGLIPFAMIYFQPSFIWWVVIFPFHMWGIVNAMNSSLHHHSHWPTFINKKVNRVYEVYLSAILGIPHQLWKWAHISHHCFVNDKPINGKTKDPVSVFKGSNTDEPENFWHYCITGPSGVIQFVKDILRIKQYPKPIDQRQFEIEMNAFRIYMIAVMLLDWQYGIWFWCLFAVALFFNAATSYGEHWGVLDRRGDTTQDSIGIYTRWYNFVGFGAGYHQEHHNSMMTHWTKLSELTSKMHPNRKTVKTMHIFNNPYWSHFKAMFHNKP